ncbi:hypothetical protein TCAL_00903 [Tigriopus californicus]|uniref:Uncharacterized protein n=1 Tax=Tigriopus californicus TaxID=6832 RepID=A0A553P5Y6_TIGCA|nr:uncharacterized protein LOC131878467 [Tigriopus californicus]TRY73099.1 hypothetical protein TCAL_00903 [Tigriopus californicus]|eukprot:TCALIF_00903-PA protein Name:"Protein of unknown function" AED:0.02 eAED:0.02 QI:52/1/0.8/1/0.75/0.8/5/276/368
MMQSHVQLRPMGPFRMNNGKCDTRDESLRGVLSQKPPSSSSLSDGKLSCRKCPCHQKSKWNASGSPISSACQKPKCGGQSPTLPSSIARHNGESHQLSWDPPSLHPASLESHGSLPILKRLQRLSAKPSKFNQHSSPSSSSASSGARGLSSLSPMMKKRSPVKADRNEALPSEFRPKEEGTISVIHTEGPSHFLDDSNLLNDGDASFSKNSPSGFRQQRQYIPSPLSSPAAARRFGQRLGDKICSSPIVCRVKKRIRDESSGDSKRNGFCGLLSSFREQETENLFILRTGDTGRIANRVHDDKWDVWTSMGEDMWEEWEEESDSGSDNDDEDEDGGGSSHRESSISSSSDDDFLELPLNDMTISAARR